MKKAYAFAADGTEESELLCVVDVLKRADVEVKIISVCGEIFYKLARRAHSRRRRDNRRGDRRRP